MQVFVQNPATKLFLGADGLWTPEIFSGRDFKSPHDALQTCRQNRVAEFQIVLRFFKPDYQLILSPRDVEKFESMPRPEPRPAY